VAEKKNRMVQQPKWFIRFFSAVHRGWYRLTGGRVGAKFHGAPSVLLTTKGRKTGKERTWPLLAVREDDAYVLTASYGGHDQHPGWYLNLVANPDVTVRDGKRTIRGRARVAGGAERDQLYQRFVDVYSTYGDYAKATEREIPVVIVEPVEPPAH
jgi:deazaflavin-dependent oxidoreductase (nitroreductase family)